MILSGGATERNLDYTQYGGSGTGWFVLYQCPRIFPQILISMSHSCPTHWTQVLPTYWVNNHSLHTFLLCLFITPFHQIPLCLTAHLQHQSSSNWTRVSGGSIGCPTWLRTLISSVPVPTPEFWYRPTVTVPLSSYCVYMLFRNHLYLYSRVLVW